MMHNNYWTNGHAIDLLGLLTRCPKVLDLKLVHIVKYDRLKKATPKKMKGHTTCLQSEECMIFNFSMSYNIVNIIFNSQNKRHPKFEQNKVDDLGFILWQNKVTLYN
ncbi:hypothetical protein CHS0354_004963 [Potamilus streckersoni]|uniref:Uncharacterized protein n=1 Tax=Potamilus streckersoni TaxID=2493646 RepID=A0AAE0VH97_9BIVA|nr:hypothetical protein CHS0354_004963 [Potamilus streckersoni]